MIMTANQKFFAIIAIAGLAAGLIVFYGLGFGIVLTCMIAVAAACVVGLIGLVVKLIQWCQSPSKAIHPASSLPPRVSKSSDRSRQQSTNFGFMGCGRKASIMGCSLEVIARTLGRKVGEIGEIRPTQQEWSLAKKRLMKDGKKDGDYLDALNAESDDALKHHFIYDQGRIYALKSAEEESEPFTVGGMNKISLCVDQTGRYYIYRCSREPYNPGDNYDHYKGTPSNRRAKGGSYQVLYSIQPFVGIDLEKLLSKKERISDDMWINLINQAAKKLKLIHDDNRVHMDIKLSNLCVMFNASGNEIKEVTWIDDDGAQRIPEGHDSTTIGIRDCTYTRNSLPKDAILGDGQYINISPELDIYAFRKMISIISKQAKLSSTECGEILAQIKDDTTLDEIIKITNPEVAAITTANKCIIM